MSIDITVKPNVWWFILNSLNVEKGEFTDKFSYVAIVKYFHIENEVFNSFKNWYFKIENIAIFEPYQTYWTGSSDPSPFCSHAWNSHSAPCVCAACWWCGGAPCYSLSRTCTLTSPTGNRGEVSLLLVACVC